MDRGLIHIYTGNGKGKTTAAVGLCYRCSMDGFKVGFTSFLKNFGSGECKCESCFTIFRHTPFKGFWSDLSAEEKLALQQTSNSAMQNIFRIAAEERYDLIVLDEVLMAASLGAVDTQLLLTLLSDKPTGLEVVMTGAVCPAELLEVADYISEVKCVKHPYERGVCARKGIEY